MINYSASRRRSDALSRAAFQALEKRRLLSAGDLDVTFGGDGVIINDFGINVAEGRAVAVQSDGKVVVAAGTVSGAQPQTILARFETDGDRDLTFGTAGQVTIAAAQPRTLTIDSSGRILIAAGGSIFRRTSSGAPDTSFSGDGELPTGFSNFGLALESDDQIVAFSGVTVTRYTTTGALDNTFGTAGSVNVSTLLGVDPLTLLGSAATATDGSIFLGGTDDGVNLQEIQHVMKLTSTGGPDTSFSGDGLLTAQYGDDCSIGGFALQSDGKLIFTVNDGNEALYLSRLLTNGSFDNTFGEAFGGDGAFVVTSQAGRGGSSIVVDATDRFYVGSRRLTGNGQRASVERFNADGSVDASFSYDGIASIDSIPQLEDGEQFNQIALTSSGRLVGISSTDDEEPSSVVIAAFETEGAAEPIARFTATGTLLVQGTALRDQISIREDLQTSEVIVTRGTDLQRLTPTNFRRIYVDAGAGDDSIENAYNRPSTLIGNLGNDFISASGGNADEILEGSAGDDTLRGSDGSETLLGGAGNDSLDGGRSGDVLSGGVGNDTLDIGEQIDQGDDFYFGNAGIDTFTAQFSASSVRITLDGATNDGRNGDSDNVAADIEILLGGSGDDTLTGTEGVQTIAGNGGNDKISGLDGDDSLAGGSGRDTVDGGEGNDTLRGGNGRDKLNGNDGDDFFESEDGFIDTLNGGAGSDTAQRDNAAGIVDSVSDIEQFV